MDDCKLSWCVRPEKAKEMTPANEAFAGTYNSAHNISADFQLWNNRYGKEDVKDLSNYRLILSFGHTEDNALLPYCHLIVNGSEQSGQLSGGQLIFSGPRYISGSKNNGVPEENTSNFLAFTVNFGPVQGRLKESDIKDLFIDISRD